MDVADRIAALLDRVEGVLLSIDRTVRCGDCGLPYAAFPLDCTLPDDQWAAIRGISEGDYGVLCAQCIVRRASKLPGVVAVRMILDGFRPPIPCDLAADPIADSTSEYIKS